MRESERIFRRRLRSITISVLVLSFFMAIVGVVYVWYVGQNSAPDDPVLITEEKSVYEVKGVEQDPNIRVGVSIQYIDSPVSPGSMVSASAKTNADATCTIKAVYNEVQSSDSGLIEKTADQYGGVDWDWKVDESAPAGKWPITITCEKNGKSGVVVGELVVSR